MNLGYTSGLPDESRHARLQGRNLRKRPRPTESSDEDEETGVGCQTETTETVSTFCQTDRELAELTVLQRKEFNELKKENAMLSKEISDLKYRKEAQFTVEFLKKEENASILKFYTGKTSAKISQLCYFTYLLYRISRMEHFQCIC